MGDILAAPPGRPAGPWMYSARTGDAWSRNSTTATRRNDTSMPTVNVSAATPTASAPTVIAVRRGWVPARPTPSAIGAGIPGRVRRVRVSAEAGPRGGIEPVTMASVAGIRPARHAGPSAATAVMTSAVSGTATSTCTGTVATTGTPSAKAVSARIGPDRTAPATTP